MVFNDAVAQRTEPAFEIACTRYFKRYDCGELGQDPHATDPLRVVPLLGILP